MTGPEHYRRAEALLDSCKIASSEGRDDGGRIVESYPERVDDGGEPNALLAALVHATLAHAAATVEPARDWTEVLA